jgi:hypothetical protein
METIIYLRNNRMEAVSEANSQSKAPIVFSLARIALVVISVLSFIGYYAPYVMGLAYYQHLMSLYDVPSGLFERSPSQIFMFAYSAVLEVFGNWTTLISHSYVIPGVFFCVMLFTAEIAALGWLIRTDKINGTIDRTVKSRFRQICLSLLIFCACITIFIAAFPVAVYPLIAFPAKLGGFGADLSFERQQKLYQGGCGLDNPKHVYCKAVIGKDGVLGVGYLIISSDNRVALYQPNQTKILKLGDEVIEVMPPDAFNRYEASKRPTAP